MTVKLTRAEYKKACDAGIVSGSACACYGKAKEEDDYCGCIMNMMNRLTEEGQIKYKAYLKSIGQLSYSELDAMYAGPPKLNGMPATSAREKRIQRMKELGYNTDAI